jgi:hypothetical protein
MSWEIINQILGQAALDAAFAQKLLSNPLEAIRARGFILTLEEEKAFAEISANDLYTLCQQLVQKLKR